MTDTDEYEGLEDADEFGFNVKRETDKCPISDAPVNEQKWAIEYLLLDVGLTPTHLANFIGYSTERQDEIATGMLNVQGVTLYNALRGEGQETIVALVKALQMCGARWEGRNPRR